MGKNYEDYDEHDAQDDRQKQQAKSTASDLGRYAYNNSSKNKPKEESNNTKQEPPENKNPQHANTATNANNANTAGQAGNSAASAAGGATGSGAATTTASAGSGVATGAGTAAGAGAGAGGGAATGAATGAAVGPAGAAIGAGIGVIAGDAAKKNAENVAKEAALKANEEPVLNDKKSKKVGEKTGYKTTTTDDNFAVKALALIVGIILTIVIITISLLFNQILNVMGPILYTWEALCHGATVCKELIEDLGGNTEPTFKEVTNVYVDKLKDSLSKAYLDTCYKVVYQIAIENDYHLGLTLESYKNTEFPYILDGEKCNVNYAELISIIAISEKFGTSYLDFDYVKLCETLQDKEFLRCLYDLTVTPAEAVIIKESYSDKCVLNADGSVTMTNEDGTTTTYTGEAAQTYCETVIYGQVSVDVYPLKKLYEYFEIDPYAKNKYIPTMNNYQALSYMEHFSRSYYNIQKGLGYEQRSELLDYTKYTGELTTEVSNVYEKDIYRESIITETHVYYEVPEYKQGRGSPWAQRKYGSGTMAKLGCCVTSMAMVCDYFSSEDVDPGVLLTHINETNGGQLNRPQVAKDYGFKSYASLPNFRIEVAKGELVANRLVIAHIKAGAKGTGTYGHYVVLTGFYCEEGEDPFFYVNEPASRLEDTIGMQDAEATFDALWSYGY